MTITRKRLPTNNSYIPYVYIGGSQLKEVESYRYLGVLITITTSPGPIISQVCAAKPKEYWVYLTDSKVYTN